VIRVELCCKHLAAQVTRHTSQLNFVVRISLHLTRVKYLNCMNSVHFSQIRCIFRRCRPTNISINEWSTIKRRNIYIIKKNSAETIVLTCHAIRSKQCLVEFHSFQNFLVRSVTSLKDAANYCCLLSRHLLVLGRNCARKHLTTLGKHSVRPPFPEHNKLRHECSTYSFACHSLPLPPQIRELFWLH